MADFLLHSMIEFAAIVRPCIDLVDPDRIVEIGAEGAATTQWLAQWASDHGAVVHTVDPFPSDALKTLCDQWDVLDLVPEMSTDALARLEPAEVYLIDGDHNYFTVAEELRLIEERRQAAGAPPYVLFLHDVGWPCGRRDMYYAPAKLPEEAVHPYTFDDGVVLDDPGTVAGGFRSNGEFAIALEEGGDRNGVLTAVEDFMADHPELEYAQVPAVFGLGIVFAKEAPYAGDLRAAIASFVDNPLIARLEENRLSLYLRLLELQDQAIGAAEYVEQLQSERDAERDGRVQEQLRNRDLLAENRALHARIGELEGALRHERMLFGDLRSRADLAARLLGEVGESRAFLLTEWMSALHARGSDRAGLSRKRLRDAAADLER